MEVTIEGNILTEEFDPVTSDIIDQAVDTYFIENKYGVRFYKTTKLRS